MNEKIMQAFYAFAGVGQPKPGHCPFCKKLVHQADFRNDISVREYGISGLCQQCQDATFGGD